MTNRPPRGFSLVEVLVSMTIGTAILLLAAAALRSAGDGYDRNTGNVGAERESRALLTQVAEDLSKLTDVKDLVIVRGQDRWSRDRIGFLCLQPREAQAQSERIGDLCAVSYYVKDLEVGGELVRCLVRGFRDSSETYAAVKAGAQPSLFDEQPQDEPVAFGVLGFEVVLMKRTGTGALEEWQPPTGEEGLPVPSATGADALRIRLTVARRELVGKLRNRGDWDSGGPAAGADAAKWIENYEVIHPFFHEN